MWCYTAVWITIAMAVLMLTFSQRLLLWMARKIWAPGIIWLAGMTVEVEGGEDVDWTEPHIFIANHQSAGDILAAFVACPVPLRFIAKKMFLYLPFFGLYMWAAGMIFVDRARSSKAVASMRAAGGKIREGANIIAFPEGTRSLDDQIAPFKKGIFIVALEAGVPIVPLAIEGTAEAMPPHRLDLPGGKARVRIGKPIDTLQYDRTQRDALIRDARDALIDLHVSIGGTGGDKHEAIAHRPEPELESGVEPV